MSASLKAAEITVRVIVVVLQLMIVLGGALVIGLFPIGKVIAVFYFGGAAIVVAVIVSIYEVIMIAFALIERVNHPARLVVDIILNSVMAGITALATLVAIIMFFLASGGIGTLNVVIIFALPSVLGVIYSIVFIVSAIVAGIIRSKLIKEARSASSELQSTPAVVAPESKELRLQSFPVGVSPPLTSDCPPDSKDDGLY